MARKVSYKSRRGYSTIRRIKWRTRVGADRWSIHRSARVRNPLVVHMFKRTQEYDLTMNPFNYAANSGGFFSNDTITAGQTNSFKLSKLDNYTEFTNLFDQYRICGVKLKWILSVDSANLPYNSTAAASAGLPLLYTMTDKDDGVCSTSWGEMNQVESLKINRLDRVVSRFVKPKVASTVYSGGAFSGYAQMKGNPWIDIASPNAEYYGLKWGIQLFDTTANVNMYKIKLVATYYMQFRDVR